ncbi:MAG: hypothetical protein RL732_1645, partial [Bacteroidota bacterium]
MPVYKSPALLRLSLPLGLVLLISSGTGAQELSPALKGLTAPAEVIRDTNGVNHIYAGNTHDLFFLQGYLAATDRLFQFECWRRQATGTVAELLGPAELKRDIGARLFRFRGDMNKELSHYHTDGKAIINAYVDGVNCRIDQVIHNPTLLPEEFRILGIVPGKWTPEVVVSRHQGLLSNVEEELKVGRAVALAGEEKVKELYWFHPKQPDIRLDPFITREMLSADILGLYSAFRKPLRFESTSAGLALNDGFTLPEAEGSNNWVVAGKKTANGFPILANDPHRAISVPSLRYLVHLVAPGWNVIGAGEPTIPGISIGHNETGAWGLTIFETDAEDLYAYELNPDDLREYRYQGQWKKMETIMERIPVKGQDTVTQTLYYTIHGPVCFIDSARKRGYAIRCGWLEPGGAPYLASLRMDQATDWNEFRDACAYSHIPGENMVWADRKGNIGWQVVGISPVRNTHSGLVPVPGDGRYEWSGYIPMLQRPSVANPEKGFWSTANQQLTPENYT